jgi:DNA-binding GntR family transcriptional regulator
MPESFDPESSSHKQLHHWIADQIRAAIIGGKIKPGDWLRQEKLAQEYSVSQMPVREALKELAAEGLVEHVPYRGVRVISFTADDIEDLYAVRSLMEGLAARAAAKNITREELDDLYALEKQMSDHQRYDDLTGYRELNQHFHMLIINASRRAYLMRSLAQTWDAFPTILYSNIAQTAVKSLPGRDVSDANEHLDIIHALEAGDGDKAETLVRQHIDHAGRELVDVLRSEE